LFVLFIPLIGVLVYLIAGGTRCRSGRHGRLSSRIKNGAPMRGEAAGSQSSADQLAKLADLRVRGVISAEEFEREKAKILAA
jgi:hypothetical protein